MTVTIKVTDDIDACHALRRLVFIEEQNVSEAEEVDGLDDQALHLLATDGTTPIGCARILIKGETAKIGRVCVVQSHRGQGIGAALIAGCLETISKDSTLRRAVLGAQLHALTFYEKLGFRAFGPIYDDAGIDHRDMERLL